MDYIVGIDTPQTLNNIQSQEQSSLQRYGLLAIITKLTQSDVDSIHEDIIFKDILFVEWHIVSIEHDWGGISHVMDYLDFMLILWNFSVSLSAYLLFYNQDILIWTFLFEIFIIYLA